MSSLEFSFTNSAYKDYKFWVKNNPQIVRKINALIDDAVQHPFEGLGKPEALKFDLTGCWSRRINQQHRLVYRVIDNELQILSCRIRF